MKMKQLLAFVFLLSIAFTSNAQTVFRVEGGISLPKYSFHNNSGEQNRKIYQGYTAGIMLSSYDLMPNSELKGLLGINLGLHYMQAGAINPAPSIVGAVESKNRINYLQGEVLGSLHIRSGLNMELMGGLVLSKALSGTYKVKSSTGVITNTDMKFGSATTDDFHKIDPAFKMGVLFNVKAIYLGVWYQAGLVDIAPQEDIRIKNTVYSFTLGLNLGKKRR